MATPEHKPRKANLDFIYLCEHAFADSEGRPCLIGIIDRIAPRVPFPIWYAKLTVALRLRGQEQSGLTVTVQFGPAGDVMRQEKFNVSIGPSGTILVPFNMIQ